MLCGRVSYVTAGHVQWSRHMFYDSKLPKTFLHTSLVPVCPAWTCRRNEITYEEHTAAERVCLKLNKSGARKHETSCFTLSPLLLPLAWNTDVPQPASLSSAEKAADCLTFEMPVARKRANNVDAVKRARGKPFSRYMITLRRRTLRPALRIVIKKSAGPKKPTSTLWSYNLEK